MEEVIDEDRRGTCSSIGEAVRVVIQNLNIETKRENVRPTARGGEVKQVRYVHPVAFIGYVGRHLCGPPIIIRSIDHPKGQMPAKDAVAAVVQILRVSFVEGHSATLPIERVTKGLANAENKAGKKAKGIVADHAACSAGGYMSGRQT